MIAYTVKRTIRYHRLGNNYRWGEAMGCARVVGQRVEGETQALGKVLALSVDQIENLARAAVTYRSIRNALSLGCGLRTRLGEYRQRLTPSHFASLGRLWKKWEFGPLEAFSHLQTAAELGASVEAMSRLVNEQYADCPPDRAWRTWDYAEEEWATPDGFGEWRPDGLDRSNGHHRDA